MESVNKSIRYKFKSIIILSLLMLVSSSILAKGVDLSGRNDEDTARDATSKPAEVIHFAGVKQGDKVLDFLGGGGYYSEILSRVVGEKGEVVLQIPQAYLKYVGKELDVRLADDRLKNVTYLLSEPEDLRLGSDKYDSVFLILGYHDLYLKAGTWTLTDAVMEDVLKSIKKGGKLLVIDHNAAEGHGSADADSLHRIEGTFVIAALEKHGFELESKSDLLMNAADDHTKSVFDPVIRRKTDRFVLLFEKK